MKLAIVHLSDIHFTKASDLICKRREMLANAIAFYRSPDETLVFLVTGDIAYSGHPLEYEIASQFFRPLLISFGIYAAERSGLIVFIPGNHDCDFRDPGDFRPILLNSIQEQLDNIEVDGATVEAMLQVQAPFFTFNAEMTGEELSTEEQLFRTRMLTFGKYSLELRCFNSAWLSRTRENPGSLGPPTATVSAAGRKTDSDVVISIIHHPYNWLNQKTYQEFRRSIRESSDFLMTGHEHAEGGQIVSSFGGDQLVHLEGGALQPPRSGESRFGLLHLDLEKRTWRRETFKWSGGSYLKAEEGDLVPIASKEGRSASLQISERFLKHLNDPGTGFLHPRQSQLTLADIYIFPDLKTRSVSRRLRLPNELPRDIQSSSVAEKLLAAERVIIAGPPDSGKTALAKMLFSEASVKHSRFALLLCADSFKRVDPSQSFREAVDVAIDEQYGLGNRGNFVSLERNRRVLLIDDWDAVSFSRAGRSVLLESARAQFGCVALFADDIFLIEELSGRYEASGLSEFQVADIREFGFRLRGQLVRKWHALGNRFAEDEQVFAKNVAASTHVVDTVLGRNLLPSYPVNILTLLQTYDAGAGSQNGGLGSYGQVYEALITARLAKASVKSIDIGTKITFLSRLAWSAFNKFNRTISSMDWHDAVDEYYKEYAIRIDSQQLQDSLLQAGILNADASGFRFTYGYTSCYFVAKYFQENLADLSNRSAEVPLYKRLKLLSESVYKQDNASIIIFYVFLTKDRELINHVISNARKIFKEFTEFDFDSDLQFLNVIAQPIASMNLPSSHPESNQLDYDRRRDEAGEQIEPSEDPMLSDVVYEQRLPFEQKLIIGIRYLTLMGQILRNFPGSLKAEAKLELAFESYSLALRLLTAVFTLAKDSSEDLTKEISHLLRSKMAFSGTERELRDRAEGIISEMLRQVAYSILKRLSHAVGLKELDATYRDVAALRDNSLPSRLIGLSINLDHGDKFPKDEIESLAGELEKNVFTYQTLRDLVMNHLYLFPTDYTLQQWSGALLNFQVNIPQVLGSSQKMLGR